MSEITEKLKSKFSRSQNGEIIMNIILGIWTVAACICFMTDVIAEHAVIIVFAITGFVIIAIDGYFLVAVYYYKRKLRKQIETEGIVPNRRDID